MAVDKTKELEKKLNALRNRPDKGTAGREKVDVLNDLAEAIARSGPSDSENYAREAFGLAKGMSFKAGMARSYKIIGHSYWIRGDYDRAREYFLKSLRLCEEIGDKRRIASTYNNMAIVSTEQSDYNRALEEHSKALTIRKEIHDTRGIAQSMSNMGIIYQHLGKYGQSMKYYADALRAFEEIGETRGMYTVNGSIGGTFLLLGDYDKALEHYFEALKICEEIKDKMGSAQCYVNIGIVYRRLNEFSQALSFTFKALKVFRKMGARQNVALTYHNIGGIYEGQGEFNQSLKHNLKSLRIFEEIRNKWGCAISRLGIGVAYVQLGRFDQSLEHLHKATAIFKETKEQRDIATCDIYIGQAYFKVKQYDKALKHLRRGIQLTQKIGAKDLLLKGYEYLCELSRVQRQYRRAFAYYKKYAELERNIFNAEKNKLITDMRTRYETEKKEKEAEIHRLKNVKLRKEIAKRKEMERELEKRRDQLKELVEKRTAELKRELMKRQRAEKELLKHESQLIALNRALSMVEEKQRRKTAGYLHDNISQALSLAIFKIRSLQESGSARSIRKELAQIKRIVAQTNQRTRNLTFEISPPVLYELGLEPAIEWLVGQFQTQNGISCSFKNDGSSKPLKDETRILLFQAVRELLNNVSKHARAQTVMVSTVKDDNTIRVSVEDDGTGFDPGIVGLKITRNEGFGLFNIKERLRYLGGELEVKSESGKGTSVVLSAPLKRTPGKTRRKR